MLPRQRILAGAAPRRNLLLSPDDYSISPWTGVAAIADPGLPKIKGRPAIQLTDASAAAFQSRAQVLTVPADLTAYTISFLLRRQVATPTAGVGIVLSGGSAVSVSMRINADSGANLASNLVLGGDWWRCWATVANNGGNNALTVSLFPATDASGTVTAGVVTATGANIFAAVTVAPGRQPVF